MEDGKPTTPPPGRKAENMTEMVRTFNVCAANYFAAVAARRDAEARQQREDDHDIESFG